MAHGESYEEFVDKFKPKLTTDDCYTPAVIYETVAEWVKEKYGVERERMVRPFWPGGDFEGFEYKDGCVVVDNPPFSLLSKIVRFYLRRGIPFYLFAPALTALNCCTMDICHIFTESDIVYENGAIVHSGFITNMEPDVVAKTEPELGRRIRATMKTATKDKRKAVYCYPDNVVTGALMQKYSRWGIELAFKRGECMSISRLDEQREHKKGIFGSGLLLSERAAAERAAAERAAAHVWTLSERERKLVASLDSE